MSNEDIVKALRSCVNAECPGSCPRHGQVDHGCITKLKLEAADAMEKLMEELKVCRNELCYQCGDYKRRHLGACDGCRWKP